MNVEEKKIFDAIVDRIYKNLHTKDDLNWMVTKIKKMNNDIIVRNEAIKRLSEKVDNYFSLSTRQDDVIKSLVGRLKDTL